MPQSLSQPLSATGIEGEVSGGDKAQLEETDLGICHNSFWGSVGGHRGDYAWKSQMPGEPACDHQCKEKVQIAN